MKCDRRALTLIEVVASLVLATTVVTSLLLGINRSLEQAKQTERLDQAAAFARELILQWSADPKSRPAYEEGTFDGASDFRWTRTGQESELGTIHELKEVSLQVFSGESEEPIVSYTWLETQAVGRR